MWLGEQITQRGIGNGISLIIFSGIVAEIPRPSNYLRTRKNRGNIWIYDIYDINTASSHYYVHSIYGKSFKKNLINYPKRQMGNKMYG